MIGYFLFFKIYFYCVCKYVFICMGMCVFVFVCVHGVHSPIYKCIEATGHPQASFSQKPPAFFEVESSATWSLLIQLAIGGVG